MLIDFDDGDFVLISKDYDGFVDSIRICVNIGSIVQVFLWNW